MRKVLNNQLVIINRSLYIGIKKLTRTKACSLFCWDTTSEKWTTMKTIYFSMLTFLWSTTYRPLAVKFLYIYKLLKLFFYQFGPRPLLKIKKIKKEVDRTIVAHLVT